GGFGLIIGLVVHWHNGSIRWPSRSSYAHEVCRQRLQCTLRDVRRGRCELRAKPLRLGWPRSMTETAVMLSKPTLTKRGDLARGRTFRYGPAVAALFYPLALVLLHNSVRHLAQANTTDGRVRAGLALCLAAALVGSVPALSFAVILRSDRPIDRLLAHVAFAAIVHNARRCLLLPWCPERRLCDLGHRLARHPCLCSAPSVRRARSSASGEFGEDRSRRRRCLDNRRLPGVAPCQPPRSDPRC